MSTVHYTLISDERGKSLSIIIDDDDNIETHTLASTHANFKPVLDYLLSTDPEDVDVRWIEGQVDILKVVGTKLAGLSERVRVTPSDVLFDGDVLNNDLTQHIIRLVREGEHAQYAPLVAFLEKVQTNPSKKSVDSLYAWLQQRNLVLHPDGDFIAYKGVQVGAEGVSESIHAGRALVDGVVHVGHIPNPDGSVIEMPRSEVQDNTQIGCASGLHAGTWQYASEFARGRVLTVKINPRDVVSVPDDCNFQKLRVSRYVALSAIDQEFTGTTYGVEDDYDEDDYDDWGDGEDYDDGYQY